MCAISAAVDKVVDCTQKAVEQQVTESKLDLKFLIDTTACRQDRGLSTALTGLSTAQSKNMISVSFLGVFWFSFLVKFESE